MAETGHRRVLILSHSALSDTRNNGKTLSAFFANWPREKLAQLYISPEEPSFSICGRFFRVTDSEVLRAMARRKTAVGTVREPQAAEAVSAPQRQREVGARALINAAFARRLPAADLAREIAWRPRRYRSPELLAWLDDFAPEAVFFQGSNLPFMYELALWICDRYGAKLLLQLTDDYTYQRSWFSPISWINRCRYLRRFREGLRRAEAVYAIGPAMREEYARRFGCQNISVAANCVEVPDFVPERPAAGTQEDPLRLLYAGSVHTGRWRVLRAIGQCLDALREEGLYAELEVYTPNALTPKQRRALSDSAAMAYKGSLTPEQLRQKMREANVLVMVEAFARAAKKVTRLSLSTKIPEYMAAGRCMLAVGPAEVSSVRYIAEGGLGVVAGRNRREELLRALRTLFDADGRLQLVRRGLDCAREHHGREALQAAIYARIQQVPKGRK